MKQFLHDSIVPSRLWHNRDVRLVLPARAVSYFGDSLALVVLTLEIAKSDRPVLMTLMFVAFSLPLFALSSVAGRLVDEHDSRVLLVAGGSVQAAASLGLVWGPNVWAILGFVLLLQVGQSVTGPTWASLVPRIVGDDLVGKAIGVQQSLSSLAGLGGAAVGGVLYGALGYHATLLVDTTTFALLVATGAVVRTRRGRRYNTDRGLGHGAAHTVDTGVSGRSVIVSDSLLRLLVPALWLFIMVLEATNVVEVFLVTGELRASAALYGLAMAAMMLGQIVGPVLAGRVRADVDRVSWSGYSAAAVGVLVAAIGVSPTIWVALPLFAGAGVAAGALSALISTMIVTRPPEHVRGRVLATLNGTARGLSVVAMVLGGMAGQLLGARATFVACGALGVVTAFIVLRSRRGLVESAAAELDATAFQPA